MNLQYEKSRARLQAQQCRAELKEPGAAIELIRHFPAPRFKNAIIAGYWPIKNEIDPRPLMAALSSMGHEILLPCIKRAGHPLYFRQWVEGEPLKRGPYGTREPLATRPIFRPDLILIPLLAFSDRGERLGYGGGFYDRTLAYLRQTGHIFSCGAAYTEQKAAHIPTGPHDIGLDAILTHNEFRDF